MSDGSRFRLDRMRNLTQKSFESLRRGWLDAGIHSSRHISFTCEASKSPPQSRGDKPRRNKHRVDKRRPVGLKYSDKRVKDGRKQHRQEKMSVTTEYTGQTPVASLNFRHPRYSLRSERRTAHNPNIGQHFTPLRLLHRIESKLRFHKTDRSK